MANKNIPYDNEDLSENLFFDNETQKRAYYEAEEIMKKLSRLQISGGYSCGNYEV